MDKEKALETLDLIVELLDLGFEADDHIDKLRAYLTDPGYVRVPVEQLRRLEESRKSIYDFLEGKLNDFDMSQMIPLTDQIWKVANTKRWDKAMLSASQGEGK